MRSKTTGMPIAHGALCAALIFALCGVAQAQDSFVSAAEDSGLPRIQRGDPHTVAANVAGIDYDRDGDTDVLLSNGDRSVLLYRNDSEVGAPAFVDVTEAAGLPSELGPGTNRDVFSTNAFAVGDFDNNGWDDVFLANWGLNQLFLNESGAFTDVTETHLDGDRAYTSSPSSADVDNDGDLDLYLGNYVADSFFPFHDVDFDQLLVNDGQGRFVDRAPDWIPRRAGTALATAWSDADLDGDLDVFVVNDFGMFMVPNQAFRNDVSAGAGFTDVSADWGFDHGIYGMGIVFTDLDQDGFLDAFHTSIGRHLLLLGAGADGFVDGTADLGLDNRFGPDGFRVSWAPAALDLDGDGFDDLWVRSGRLATAPYIRGSDILPDAVWRGGEPATPLVGLAVDTETASRGMFIDDVDGDGRVDVVGGTTQERPTLLLGGGTDRSVRLDFESTISAPGVPGARVVTACPDHEVVRQVYAGGALGSAQTPGRIWVSVPSDCATADLRVHWPSGVVSVVEAVSPGSSHVAREPEWLHIDPRTVTAGSDALITVELIPRDDDGEVLGGGAQVAVRLDGDWIDAEDLLDGEYTVQVPIPFEPGSYPLSIRVDGEELPAHPRVEATGGGRLWLRPAHLVAGQTARALVEVTSGAPGLQVNGLAAEVIESDGSTALVEFTAPMAASATLQPTAGGAARGDPTIAPVHPLIDDQRSGLKVLYTAVGFIDLDLYLRGPNGELFDRADSVTVWRGDTQLGSASIQYAGTFAYELTGEDYVVSPDYRVEVAGEVMDTFEIGSFATRSGILAAIDPSRSLIGLSQEGCYADGQDEFAAIVQPRDAQGHTLPFLGSLRLQVDGAEVISNPDFGRGRYTFMLRCGDTPGIGSVQAVSSATPLGIGRTFDIYPPRVVDLDPSATQLEVTEGIIPTGELADALIRPFDVAGNLAGSGVNVTISLSSGGPLGAIEYCGLGEYCVTFGGPDGGGAVTVEATIDGSPTGVTGVVYFSSTSEGAEPVADLAADAGDSGGDASDLAVDRADEPSLDASADAGDGGADLPPDGAIDRGVDRDGEGTHDDVDHDLDNDRGAADRGEADSGDMGTDPSQSDPALHDDVDSPPADAPQDEPRDHQDGDQQGDDRGSAPREPNPTGCSAAPAGRPVSLLWCALLLGFGTRRRRNPAR